MPPRRCRIEPLGRDIEVREGQSVLDAALAAGLNLPHSCKAGHCGSCRATLIEGEIEYPRGIRPPGLTRAEAEQGAVLICQARARSDLVVRVRRPARALGAAVEIRRFSCRVESLQLLASDVMQLMLRPPASESFEFRAGQYLDIIVEGGRRRSFSIASPPHDATRLELHVRRAPGGGFTAEVFERMRAGAVLRVEGPLGQFVYEPGDGPLLLIAGGTGFAPLKSMLRHMFEHERSTRDVRFFWGVRREHDAYERAWIDALARQHANFLPRIVCSEGQEEGGQGAAWVHEAAAREIVDLAAREVYVAGPPQLIEAVRASYPPLGVSPSRIRFDSFDYAPA